jgi:trehalose-phosphatase
MSQNDLQHLITLSPDKPHALRELFEAAQTGNLVIFSDYDKTMGAFMPGQHDGFPQDQDLVDLVQPFGEFFVPITGRPQTFLQTVHGKNYVPYSATEHGGILYDIGTGNELVSYRVPDLSDIRGKIEKLVAKYDGAQVELHKQATLTAEFTKAANALDVVSPELEDHIRKLLESDPKYADVRLINGSVPGNCYIELVHKDVSKGNAVRYFMDNVPAFKGKKAIFLGDSAPDESGMLAAQNNPAGGFAMGVTDSAPAVADFRVKSWKENRDFLRTLADIVPYTPKP